LDPRALRAVKYDLIVATEAAISICTHVASSMGAGTPESYADCFARLAELRVLEPGLAARLGRMAQFRNRLVHLYWKMDDAQVWEIVRDNPGDLDEYLDRLGALLSGGTPDAPGPPLE
jgi:uncharacterized protein YutE (UPF0331/DUF86 family)